MRWKFDPPTQYYLQESIAGAKHLMRERPKGREGLGEFLYRELRGAIVDVRDKLIQEGWFGRRAAPPSQFDVGDLGWKLPPEPKPGGLERPSFDLMWATARAAGQRSEFERLWGPNAQGPTDGLDHASFEDMWGTKDRSQECGPERDLGQDIDR